MHRVELLKSFLEEHDAGDGRTSLTGTAERPHAIEGAIEGAIWKVHTHRHT